MRTLRHTAETLEKELQAAINNFSSLRVRILGTIDHAARSALLSNHDEDPNVRARLVAIRSRVEEVMRADRTQAK